MQTKFEKSETFVTTIVFHKAHNLLVISVLTSLKLEYTFWEKGCTKMTKGLQHQYMDVENYILYFHAFSGGDTIYVKYEKNKNKILKLLEV